VKFVRGGVAAGREFFGFLREAFDFYTRKARQRRG
jgi:hypothetical protein